ncbi:MAG: permease-like cell division protein FtsX, partial [candidate division Zixibacteria bacterium]|nr:permease-like cell division protein FtsX [candidate division Zixibacteria bacterium]
IFRTKEKALQELKGYLGEDILKGLESNPLPSSWVVKLKPSYQNQEKMQKLSSQIVKIKGVEEIDYGRFWVTRIEKIFKIFLWINLALGIFIISGSLFLMIHTLKEIRGSISEELKILNLLGAGSNFLRKIFVWEGAIQGFGSAILSFSTLFVLHRIFSFSGYGISFLSGVLSVAFLLSGFLLGGLAGLLSGGKNLY